MRRIYFYLSLGLGALALTLGVFATSCVDPMRPEPPQERDLHGITALRIEPKELLLEATPMQPGSQFYRAIGTFPDGERDVSELVGFAVEQPAIGRFDKARFISSASQGGRTKILAQAAGQSASANLVVHFSATVKVEPMPGHGNPLPTDPGSRFVGAPTPGRAPLLVYPNDGVLIPPNLARLEVHFQPGAPQNSLFQLLFRSDTATITTYTRCGDPVNGGCVFSVDPDTYRYVIGSNTGGPTLSLIVRGSDENGSGFGESESFRLQVAQENINGALYYWAASNGAIMRVDFGGGDQTPELFLSQAKNGFPNCVGCHAISRDGRKMVASIGGLVDGRTVYIADMSAPLDKLLTLDGSSPAAGANHIQFASFSPTGDRFVSVYGDTMDLAERHKLWMHDGTTGLRLAGESIALPFEPDHPDWSPDGRSIAFTHVGMHNFSQRPQSCSIDLITQRGGSWDAPVNIVPYQAGHNRYNPNFAPDSSFFVYTESLCPGGDNKSVLCNGDSDPSAKTWATKPTAGATQIYLAKANAPGIMDGSSTDLSNTFPRFSPFAQKQGTGRLFWITVASRRRLGLRNPPPTPATADPIELGMSGQVLWMFAVDPDKLNAGQDGSYPAFFLPFQDLSTSNHIGQWTQRVVNPG